MIFAWKRRAVAVVAIVACSACTPPLKRPPVESIAADLIGVGDPFVFQSRGETIDSFDSAGERLTFEQAIRSALRHDPDIQAALARARVAEADARQTRLLPNPILSVAVRIRDGGGSPNVDAGLGVDLLSLLSRPGRTSSADQRLRKSAADALVTVLDVLANVQLQYVTAQTLAAQLAIDESRQTTLASLERVTAARVEAGEAPRLDVLTVQGEQANLNAALIARRGELRQAQIELARTIGNPSSAAAWTLDEWIGSNVVPASEAASIRLALERRPELNVVRWELAALGDDLHVARLFALDGSAVGAGYEREDGNDSIGPAATFPLPLFDLGQAGRDRLRARIVEQRHELTKTSRQIVQEVRLAIEQSRAANEAAAAIERRSLPLQEERLRQAERAYRLGLADVLAVRVAEQDRQRVLEQQTESRAQVSRAAIRLARAIGGPMRAVRPTTQSIQETTQ